MWPRAAPRDLRFAVSWRDLRRRGFVDVCRSTFDAAGLIRAFVTVQMVHFCAVIALQTKFAAEPLHLGGPKIAVVLIGFSIVAAVGMTAEPQLRGTGLRNAYVVLLYIFSLIFAIDYAKHPAKPFRLVAAVVIIALVVRHVPRRGTGEAGVILAS